VIGGTLPGEADTGPELAWVVEEIRNRLEEPILMVHHATIDVRFLRRVGHLL